MARQRKTAQAVIDSEEVATSIATATVSAEGSDIEDEGQYHVIVQPGCVLRPGECVIKGKHVKANRDHVHVIRAA